MNIPRWKKLFSYVDDLLLEETSSKHNDLLQIYLSKGQFMLATESAIYSYGDRYENFTYAFDRINWKEHEISNVLVLGMGLASIPYILEKKMGKDFNYSMVEIDEEVIHLSNKYVIPDLHSSIEIIHADAAKFISQNQRKYDLICMDVFVDNIIPEQFRSEASINAIKRSLSKNGLLIYNVLYTGFEESCLDLLDSLEEAFNKVWFDDVENNRLFYAKN